MSCSNTTKCTNAQRNIMTFLPPRLWQNPRNLTGLKSVSCHLHASNMASTAKPHIIIVPGVCHVGHHWRLFMSSMERAGYGATFQPLLCNIEGRKQPPPNSIIKSVAAIRAAVVKQIENGCDVVVIAHSAGGVAAGGALSGLGKIG